MARDSVKLTRLRPRLVRLTQWPAPPPWWYHLPVDAPKVLIVTQNAEFLARVREELSSAGPSVEVLTARTGADAALVGQSAQPRHVIVSLHVPDLDESQAIERLIDAVGGGGVQILAVHDSPTEWMKAKARAAGARMVLPTAVVIGSVRELLGL